MSCRLVCSLEKGPKIIICNAHTRILRCSLAVLTLGFLAVVPNDASAQTRTPRPFVERNITYCQIDGANLKLDLARPSTGDGPFPAIVFVHGGGWRSGNRQAYQYEIINAAVRGFAAITVTYRLTRPIEGRPAASWPAQIHDVKCAVRWLRANASKYRVDPKRIGIYGESAGAHLALLVGLTDKSAGLEGSGGYTKQSSRVQAVVNFYGPTDMTRLYATSGGIRGMLEPFLGGSPQQAAKRYLEASPVRYASKNDPPVLTLHGDRDTLVPTEQARLLDRSLKAAGVSHELHFVKGVAHGFPRPVRLQSWAESMYPFFARVLRNNAKGIANSKPAVTKTSPPSKPKPSQNKPATSPAIRNRETALWVLQQGGSVTVSANGRSNGEIKKETSLPKSAFVLEKVSLNLNAELTDAGMKHFEGLADLKFLNLNTTRIGDEGLRHLNRCARLEVLGLFGTKVTDKGLKHLGSLKKLKRLILQNTKVTAAGVKALQNSLPKCKIGY